MQVQIESLEDILDSLDAEFGAAEVHGCLCGYFCLGMMFEPETWLATMLGIPEKVLQDKLAKEELEMLATLYQETSSQLSGSGFEFAILLPDDEQGLAIRLNAVRNWCQGFMRDSGLVMKLAQQKFSEEVTEVAEDINALIDLDAASSIATEEDERDYMEVTEYLRMAVLLLYCELTDKTAKEIR